MRASTATSRRRAGRSSGSAQTLSRPEARAPKRKRLPKGKCPAAKPRALERKTATPLCRQLAGKLIDGIQSGRFPIGSLLPREIELSGIHKVSRQTVRHAIGEWQQKGLVSARKGVGTRVESGKAARAGSTTPPRPSPTFMMAAER
jgi:DNA-binding transcriptional regulator YhcF (GntR family)